jgi:phage terminase large subunit-like protein
LEQLILEKRLARGNYLVLSMCAACAVVEGKDDANRKLSKNQVNGRVDGMIALALAVV